MDINSLVVGEEYPLPYPIPTAPASLKNLSATALALDLWRHKGSLNSTSFSCTEILSVPVPSCLVELIDKRIISLGQQLKALYSSFTKIGILRNDTFFRYFDSLTYATEDEICPEKSAMEFLKNDELTELEKFKIACVYWFVNDIRLIWPSVSNRPELTGNLDPFTYYWVYEMRGRRINNSLIDLNFIISLMRFTLDCGNWTALVKMVNKSSRQDQFNSLTCFIRFHHPIKYLISKLNRFQIIDILRDQPDDVISKLASQKEWFANVLKIWNLVKTSISSRRLLNLLNYLCYGAYICDQWAPGCHEESAQVQLVLFEVWNTIPSEKKRKIIENNRWFRELEVFSWKCGIGSDQRQGYYKNVYTALSRFFEGRKHNSSYYPVCFAHKMDFFFKLLEDMPPGMRATMWRNHWRGFVIRSRSTILNRLLSLCLVNEDKIRRFVEGEMFILGKIEMIIDLWLKQKLYSEVIDYSNLCTWNMQLVENFRRQIFLMIVPSMAPVNCNKLIELATEIDRSFPNVDTAEDAKRTIFLSNYVKNFLMQVLRKGWAKEAIHMIVCFLKTDRSQREKQLLLDPWLNFLINGLDDAFDERWKEFLSWWESTEDDWPMFKQYLNVDEIWIKLLLEAVPNLVSWLDPMETEESEIPPLKKIELDEFSTVDDFLMWFFGTEAAVRDYKLEKISNYQTIPALKNIFRMYNEFIIDKVLEWFFNGDLVEVGNFKINFKNICK